MARASRSALWLGAATCACWPSAMSAQSVASNARPVFNNSGSYREDPASALARHLRMVTASPRNLDALMGAGRAALDVGDAQAAIGFYARAEIIAPRNGRVKAGLGSALVMLNQEAAALRYFGEAASLGVPEADFASNRGLAQDLRGNAKLAQRDYAIALRRGPDPETTRRMALSLAITGEKQAALALLDPLLRKQDTAAWRARAFILAMTGDAAGASKTAASVMSAPSAAAFGPFFRKLSTLRPGEKAAAVHFGNFPGEVRPMRIDDLFNQAEVAARVALENTPRSVLDAGRIDGRQIALRTVGSGNGEGQLNVSSRRAPAIDARVGVISTPRPNAIARNLPTTPPVQTVELTAVPLRRSIEPTPLARTAVSPSAPPPAVNVVASTVVQPTLVPTASPTRLADLSAVIAAAASVNVAAPTPTQGSTPSAALAAPTPTLAPTPATTLASPASTPIVSQTSPVQSELEPVTSTPMGGRLDDLRSVFSDPPAAVTTMTLPPSSAAPSPPISTTLSLTTAPTIEQTPTAGAIRPATTIVPPRSTPKVETTAPTGGPFAPTSLAVTVAPAAAVSAQKPDDDSRVWVQVAGGSDERALPFEWKRLKTQAGDLLSTQSAWTTPLKATNRLLVGPFDSEKDAQAFVNRLKPKGITAFAWTSAKGQVINKLAVR